MDLREGQFHGASDAQAIHAFYTVLQKKFLLRHRLVREQVTDLGEMLNLAAQYAAADDDARDDDPDVSTAPRRNNKRKQAVEDKAGASNKVAVTFQGNDGKKKWKNKKDNCDAGSGLKVARITYEQAKLLP